MKNSVKGPIVLPLHSGENADLKKMNLLVTILLVSCCLITYWKVFQNDFQYKWDDHWVVMNQYTEDGLDKYNLWNVLTEFYHGQYAPVNEFFYILLYTLFGYDPFWFHAASLLIHIANVIIIYFLIVRLLLVSKYGQADIWRIPLMTSLLFATHPFLVQTVAWMSASKVLLYTFFYLLSLQFYISYITTGKFQYYSGVLLLFIISFGAKEQAVTLPFCLILFDFILYRDMSKKGVWIEKIPFFLLSVFFGIVTILSQRGPNNPDDHSGFPFYQRIILASYTLIEYLTKCLVPVKLSYLYIFPIKAGESLPLRFWIYPFIVLFLGIAVYRFRKQKFVIVGLFIFLINIGLVLNIFSLGRFEIVADRYVYLASVGIFFALSYCLNELISEKKRYRRLYTTMIVLYFSGMAVYAYTRTLVWHDSETLKMEMKELLDRSNIHEQKTNFLQKTSSSI